MNTVPTTRSAVKTRNFITKTYGGKNLMAISESNPYDDWQSLVCKLSVKQAEKLAKDLSKQQYTYDHSWEKAGHCTLYIRDDGFVTVIGDKKAKRSYLPYYD